MHYYVSYISIHALLAESDRGGGFLSFILSYFYPRSPCGERRCVIYSQTDIEHFYPRSPCGERQCSLGNPCKKPYFYPRSPCGERLFGQCLAHCITNSISIHALLAESDIAKLYLLSIVDLFLSTLSLRRATGLGVGLYLVTEISIHALLAESDPRGGSCYLDNIISIHALLAESDRPQPPEARVLKNFYPRSPCGERHDGLIASANFCKFLSTLSLRRATLTLVQSFGANRISIHALLAESDTHPIGVLVRVVISIHALLAESDKRTKNP